MDIRVWSDLIISVVQCTIYLIATEITLSMDVRKLLNRTLFYGFVTGILSTVTFQLLNMLDLHQIRLLINIFSAVILLKLIFRASWWNASKMILISAFFAVFSQTISQLIVLYRYGLTIDQTMNEHLSLIFKVYMPIDFISIVWALIFRHIKNNSHLHLFTTIDMYKSSTLLTSIIGSILFQSALLVSLFIDYLHYITLNENPLRLIIIIITNILIILISIYILSKAIRITEEKMIEASSEAMSQNLYSLINTVKSQRHDFVNHVQVINSLFYNQDRECLADYLNQLTTDITMLNNVLKVDNPLIGALLNAKITKAGILGINLNVDFNANLSNLSTKAFDMTRILGNLIDNSIEAIEHNNVSEKWLKVIVNEAGPFLCISVKNPGSPSIETTEKIFEPGYTTKGDGHSGLGLHICNQLVKKLHGKINFTITPGIETIFSVIIPK